MIKPYLLLLFIVLSNGAYAQVSGTIDSLGPVKSYDPHPKYLAGDDLSMEYDLVDLYDQVLHPKKQHDSIQKSSGLVLIPNIAANPTIGAQIGIKAVGGKRLGDDPHTYLSVAASSASITTKGIVYFYISHNIFTPGNKWNLQGNLVIAKTLVPDFGLGIGQASDGSPEDKILADPERKVYALHSLYYNLREKVFKEVKKDLFLGLGMSFDIRRSIESKDTAAIPTPFDIYSDRHGFSRTHYSANGLFAEVEYTTRDNQNRAYKGIYIDAGFRLNTVLLGSTKNAIQFTTDIRKYISLSARNPEHVIAFWNWGSYLLTGDVPYLELPGTAKEPGGRSGRGYTVGYFKGTQYNYSESEYRFPILRNKFISGVVFANLQTANDASGTKLFEKWQVGYGGGLRILFKKSTRTNLCLDYAFGNYGSKGFFLNLNEAF